MKRTVTTLEKSLRSDVRKMPRERRMELLCRFRFNDWTQGLAGCYAINDYIRAQYSGELHFKPFVFMTDLELEKELHREIRESTEDCAQDMGGWTEKLSKQDLQEECKHITSMERFLKYCGVDDAQSKDSGYETPVEVFELQKFTQEERDDANATASV